MSCPYRLLTPGKASPKLAHMRGVESAILYLAPHRIGTPRPRRGERPDLCPFSTPGCRAGCLFTAGRGRFAPIRAARIRRTRLLLDNPARFHSLLRSDLRTLAHRAYIKGLPAVARLDGTSDIGWGPVYQEHPSVGFWEYTKDVARVERFLRGGFAPNLLRLVYSRSEAPWSDGHAHRFLELGATVSVVFSTPRGAALPATWQGFPVVDGDASDARWQDPPGSVVGLRAKGRARRDRTGFVVQV